MGIEPAPNPERELLLAVATWLVKVAPIETPSDAMQSDRIAALIAVVRRSEGEWAR